MSKYNENENLKKITLYDGVSEKNIVCKSRCWMYYLAKMTKNQLILLDIFLSRINPKNPDKYRVVFKKKDFERILGIKRIRNEVLKDLLQELLTTCSIVENPEDDRNFRLRPLFSEIISYVDKNTNEQIIVMEANMKERWMFFNIENQGYAKHRLENVTRLNSAYAIRMFSYLQFNSFRVSWNEEIDELKKILSCEKEKVYEEYYRFNSLLLKKVCDEINEKTSLKYKYSHKKDSTKIEFTIVQIDKFVFVESNDDTEQNDIEENDTENKLSKEIANIFKGFSLEMIDRIKQELLLIDSDVLFQKYNTDDLFTGQINLLNDLNNEYIEKHPTYKSDLLKCCMIEEKLRVLQYEE